MAHTVDESLEDSFSVIAFFAHFKRKIAACNREPIVVDNIDVQQDAYRHLATDDRDDELFASFEYGQKTQDTGMRFGADFYTQFFVLHMEGMPSAVFAYQECFASEQDAATQIVAALRCMANGQIACLMTSRNGEHCASELLLYQKGATLPHVLATEQQFPGKWRKSDATGYECRLLRNSFAVPKAAIPLHFFMADYDVAGALKPRVRVFRTPELTPLTKGLFYKSIEAITMKEIGQRPGESDSQVLFRSPEYWVFVIALLGIGFVGYQLGILPQFVVEYPIVILPVTTFLAGLILLPLLMRKERLKVQDPGHWWVRADQAFTTWVVQDAKRLSALFMAGVLFATSFFPMFDPKATGDFVNLYNYAAQGHPVLFAVPVLFVLAIAAAWRITKQNVVWQYFAAVTAGVALLLGYDYFLSGVDSTAGAPEPYTTISIVAYLAFPLLSFFVSFARAKFLAGNASETNKKGTLRNE